MNVLWQCPPDAIATVVLAPGAGAGMSHQNMQSIADAFERSGIATLRFNFPFMDAGKILDDRSLTTFDVPTSAKRSILLDRSPEHLAMTEGGTYVVIAQENSTELQVYDGTDLSPLCSIAAGGVVTQIAAGGKGHIACALRNSTVSVWNIEDIKAVTGVVNPQAPASD